MYYYPSITPSLLLNYYRKRIYSHLESTCKHLHDHTIPLRGEVWANKTSLTPPLLIEVPVPSMESERACICVLGVSILPLSTILIFDFGFVPTVWFL
jgi:hypothetical protein